MCCNFPTIKITEGNAFTLIFPLKRRSYVAERPIDEDIDVTRLSNVHVTLGGVEYAPTIETYGVRIDVPATLVRGTYDGLLTAEYDGNAIRGAYESCVQIVAWNAQSNAQQYIIGSPVATKAAYVLGYMPTDADVEALKQQLRDQIAAAEQAEAEAIAEKKRYAEAIEHLEDIAHESTLTQGVSDIRNDIANIDIDSTTLAKESTAQQAAEDAAAAKDAAQALSPIAQAADAYNEGKPQLAQAITAKGVTTAADASLATMANNVLKISQDTIQISGDKIYEEQMFGAETDTENPLVQAGSPLWNLYHVCARLRSLNNSSAYNNTTYEGIVLCELPKESDTITLSGVPAGGCYVLSDNPLEQVNIDREHIWTDAANGKMNRWLAFMIPAGTKSITLPSTISPLSVHIGGKVGTIVQSYAGRIREVAVVDGCELGDINFGSTQSWDINTILRNVKTSSNGKIINNNSLVKFAYIGIESITGGETVYYKNTSSNMCSITFGTTKISNGYGIYSHHINAPSDVSTLKYLSSICFENLTTLTGGVAVFLKHDNGNFSLPSLKTISFPRIEVINGGKLVRSELSNNNGGVAENLSQIYAPKLKRIDSGSFLENGYNVAKNHGLKGLIDIVVGSMETNLNLIGWDCTTVLSSPIQTMQLITNIRAHIYERVSDRTGLSPLTFTFGGTSTLNSYSAGTEEENVEIQALWTDLKNDFANIKNWTVQ